MSFGWEMIHEMSAVGLAVFVLLALMFAAVLYLGTDGWLALRRAQRQARTYANLLQKHLKEGDFEGAAELKGQEGGPIGVVLAACAKDYVASRDMAPSLDAMLESIEETAERTRPAALKGLRSRLGPLATMATISPFVGLFGTVVGIVQSFQGIAETGSGGLDAVAAGIAEALYATALGIMVAIPAVVVFNWLNGKTDHFEDQISAATGSFVDAVRKATWQRNGGKMELEAAE